MRDITRRYIAPIVLVTTMLASAGNDLFDVKVSMDGAPLQERLDGKPVLVDAGEHHLRFEGGGLSDCI